MAIPEDLYSNKEFQASAHCSFFLFPRAISPAPLQFSFRILQIKLSSLMVPQPFFLPRSLSLCSQLVLILKPQWSPLVFPFKLPFSFFFFSPQNLLSRTNSPSFYVQLLHNLSTHEQPFSLSCSRPLFLKLSPIFLPNPSSTSLAPF